MADAQFDFLFLINEKFYPKYGSNKYKTFINEIKDYAKCRTGKFEIKFKNKENKWIPLNENNFSEFTNMDHKEIQFIKDKYDYAPEDILLKFSEKIKNVLIHHIYRYLGKYFILLKKDKENRKNQLIQYLLMKKKEKAMILQKLNEFEDNGQFEIFQPFYNIRKEFRVVSSIESSVNESAIRKKP